MHMLSLVCAAAFSLALAGGALAFEASDDGAAAPSAAAPATTAKPAPADAGGGAERSARSIECSQKADAQGLHGKPRKHFMRECKRGR